MDIGHAFVDFCLQLQQIPAGVLGNWAMLHCPAQSIPLDWNHHGRRNDLNYIHYYSGPQLERYPVEYVNISHTAETDRLLDIVVLCLICPDDLHFLLIH